MHRGNHQKKKNYKIVHASFLRDSDKSHRHSKQTRGYKMQDSLFKLDPHRYRQRNAAGNIEGPKRPPEQASITGGRRQSEQRQ